jgi:hypothetical protein
MSHGTAGPRGCENRPAVANPVGGLHKDVTGVAQPKQPER